MEIYKIKELLISDDDEMVDLAISIVNKLNREDSLEIFSWIENMRYATIGIEHWSKLYNIRLKLRHGHTRNQ